LGRAEVWRGPYPTTLGPLPMPIDTNLTRPAYKMYKQVEHGVEKNNHLGSECKLTHRLSNTVSWRPVYQGYTNSESHPEPGRCRRTDGKKWRCSKEAMPDHKYCERHVNRNRHRSRKPVENQSRKSSKEAPAGSLSCVVSQGSLKKAKVNDLKPGIVSYWTDSLIR
jgi:hypothetical protein